MEMIFIIGFVGVGLVFLTTTYLFLGKIKELRSQLEKLEKVSIKKVEDFFLEKEKSLNKKIETIRSWEKYIHLNIGDPVYHENNLILGKGSKDELSFTVYVESEILDIAKNKAKIKVIDVSFNKSDNRIKKKDVVDFINNNQCWVEMDILEKRISIEDRRDMQLNKILK